MFLIVSKVGENALFIERNTGKTYLLKKKHNIHLNLRQFLIATAFKIKKKLL